MMKNFLYFWLLCVVQWTSPKAMPRIQGFVEETVPLYFPKWLQKMLQNKQRNTWGDVGDICQSMWDSPTTGPFILDRYSVPIFEAGQPADRVWFPTKTFPCLFWVPYSIHSIPFIIFWQRKLGSIPIPEYSQTSIKRSPSDQIPNWPLNRGNRLIAVF